MSNETTTPVEQIVTAQQILEQDVLIWCMPGKMRAFTTAERIERLQEQLNKAKLALALHGE